MAITSVGTTKFTSPIFRGACVGNILEGRAGFSLVANRTCYPRQEIDAWWDVLCCHMLAARTELLVSRFLAHGSPFPPIFHGEPRADQREGQKRHDVATGLCVFVSETVIVLLKLLPATAACDAQSIIVRRTCVPTRLAVDEF